MMGLCPDKSHCKLKILSKKKKNAPKGLEMMVHACNPWGGLRPAWGWWFMFVILAIQEAEVEGLRCSTSLGKSMSPYLKKKLKAKGLGM
jgi:hypothetical protein